MMFSLMLVLLACRSEDGVKAYNSEPQATIVSHVDGDELLDGVLVALSGSVTDANHGFLELTTSWRTNNRELCIDIPADAQGSTSCMASFQEGENELTLIVEDPNGATGIAQISVSVLPTAAPTAIISSPVQDGIYYADQKLTFEGLVGDAEDDAENLKASWSSDIDGDLSAASLPNAAGELVGAAYLSEGQHFVLLTVEDSTGKTGTDHVTVTVGPPNSTPLCEIVAPSDNAVGQQGETVLFRGLTSDVDVPISWLTVNWVSDKDGDLGSSTPDSDGNVTFAYADLSIDTHVISMIVRDELEAECIANLTYTVGSPPSVSLDAPLANAVYHEGQEVDFVATVSDQQDLAQDLSLNWTLDGNLFSTQGADASGVAAFSDATLSFGSYALALTATDSHGLSSTVQRTVTINGVPSQPTISITPSLPDTSNQLSAVVDVPALDPEGASVSYTYAWYKDNVLQAAQTTAVVDSLETTKGETWKVQVIANDGLVDGPAGEAEVTIQNTEPAVGTVTISPNTGVTVDSVLSCTASVSDPDESVVAVYEWSIDGVVVAAGANVALASTTIEVLDTVTCTVSVSDSDGASAVGSASVNVENRLPTVSNVLLTPALVYTNDQLSVIANLADDDSNQQLTATYEWHVVDADSGVDSIVQLSANQVLDGSLYFDRDDDVYVIVTPNDGLEDGAPVTSTGVTIANSVPSTPSIGLTPNPAAVMQDDLSCAVDTESIDSDGDTILYTYVWADPSGIVVQTTADVVDVSDILDASLTSVGSFTCTVSASDGSASNGVVSASTVVENTDPCVDLQATEWPVANGGNGHCYALRNEQTALTWSEAKQLATDELATLVTLTSEAENDWVFDTFVNDPTAWVSSGLARGPMIGAYEDSGVWRWVTNEPYVYTNWRAGDPNGGLNNDVACFLGNAGPTNEWADINYIGEGNISYLIEWNMDDIDADGVLAYEDCDDQDANVSEAGSGVSQDCPGASCLSILNDGYSSGDGGYWIDPLGTGAFEVHCDMSTDGGGWTRIVNADYRQDSCPSGWPRSTSFSDVCSRETSSASDYIRSTTVDALGVGYDEVRGYVIAYQYGSGDGFGDYPPNNLNDAYFDGLSITHSPNGAREHLFSYALGYGKSGYDDSNCPGVNGGASPQSFVGSNYHCESANQSGGGPSSQWYTAVPLYSNTWFQVGTSYSSADIELRMMASSDSSDEDIGVEQIILFVR